LEAVGNILRSRRFNKWLPWVSVAILAVGAVAFLVTFYGNTASTEPEKFTNEPAVDVSKPPAAAPLAPEVRRVAGQFILTAVERKDLDKAWQISGPGIRQGMTLAEWRKGEIPVVPYKLGTNGQTRLKVDESTKNSALLEVALLPGEGSDYEPQIFFIELKKFGKGEKARWLVEQWSPREIISVPSARD
jgi:hypothetical protein